MSTEKNTAKRLKGWVILISTFAALYIFAVGVGPWLQHKIYSFDEIVQVIEENNIDSGAYFYTEIEGSYQGEQYLKQSLSMAKPDEFGFTLPFLSGIAACLVILWFGWRYVMPE